MSTYKTILVHLTDERTAPAALATAARLASDHDAHLVGLFMDLPDVLTPPFAIGRSIVEAGRAEIRRRAKAFEAIFESAGPGLSIRKEWRFVSPKRASAVDTLMSHVRSADLIVTAQTHADWQANLVMEYPEDLLMQSGRPVLYVPYQMTHPTAGKRVLLAWNERREAARAAFDSLPILQRAENVGVVWIDPEAEKTSAGDVPTAEIVRTLARHGVRATAMVAHGNDADVGTVLLTEVAATNSDLLVMGGYGRWRLREYVFGGATRQIIRAMTCPVLMSH